MKQTVLPKKTQKLMLLLALIGVLFVLFANQSHQFDSTKHNPNQNCKVCLKLTSLDNVLIMPDSPISDSNFAGDICQFIPIPIDDLIAQRVIYVRGPPQHSS